MDELTNNLSLLGKLMDTAALRSRVVANNLANVNTPGFTRSKVVFEETMSQALRQGRRDQAEKLEPQVEEDLGGKVKPDGNNVHMETEMTELVKSTVLYNILNRIIDGKIKGLRTAIQGH